MQFHPIAIKDAFTIEPRVWSDDRGYFTETFRQDLFDAFAGRHVEFVQDNESMSTRGVLRGLHFQSGDTSQAKLVRVSRGKVLDVIVDLRRDSPTFRQHAVIELSEDNHRQLFVPRGMAHGFFVLSDVAVFQYKVDNTYSPSTEHTLRFDDPALGLPPHISDPTLLSPKDLNGLTLAELEDRGLLF